MKRIKEYINKYPKLKRVAKILGVVAIVFSFLFNALIIGSLIINANKPSDSNKVLAYGDYQPKTKEVVTIDNDLFVEGTLSLSDDLAFWRRYCHYLSGTSPNDFYWGYTMSSTDQSNTYTYNTNVTGLRYTTNIQDILDNGWDNWDDPNLIVINSLTFSIYRGANTDYNYRTITLNLANSQVRNVIILEFDNGLFTGDFTSGVANNNASDYRLYYDGFVFANYTTFYSAWRYTTGDYWDGYYAGEEYGYQQGYYYGKSDGYQEGLDSQPTGAFNLITTAFNSIASILNIDILPNLSLGLLVFLPVVIVVIIVVVKMIRG